MTNNLESKIRFKALLIYIIVGLACGISVLYIYDVKDSIDLQTKKILRHKNVLKITNELVYAVNEAQNSAGAYIFQNNPKYIQEYKTKILHLQTLIDSINFISNYSNKYDFTQLVFLINKQYEIINEINLKFKKFNPLTSVNKTIEDYKPTISIDSVVITTVSKDSITKPLSQKKGFFSRLARAFNPKKDSIKVISKKMVDTLKLPNKHTPKIINQVDSAIKQAGLNYTSDIKLIERQISGLLKADQKLSEQISSIVMRIYGKTLHSTIESIDTSSQLIERNNIYSIIGVLATFILLTTFIVLIIADINKGRQNRVKLEELNMKNMEIMESRHRLLLSVSHDIKTPLASILGYLELMPKSNSYISPMESSGKYILSLLDNLINFSAIEQGKISLDTNTFSLEKLNTSIIDMFEPLALSKGIDFIHKTNFNKNIELDSDEIKIKQIIINLLSNALKYTPKGFIELNISYSNDNLIIKVKDSGVGIPQNYIDKIFIPFKRVEQNNALAHGTGVGLFVVKSLIELFNGKIYLSSKVGEGTEFLLELPIKANTQINTNNSIANLNLEYAENEQVNYNSLLPDKNAITPLYIIPKRILVLDDDAVLLSMCVQMLNKLGHIASGSRSMENIYFDDYDYILTDYDMGAFSALDVLAAVDNVPLIIMTARVGFTKEEAIKLGFSDYLPKPFTISILRTIFREAKLPLSIKEMFGDDIDSLKETLNLFESSTKDNIKSLQKAILENDYNSAQSICHKMLPMFSQMELNEVITILKKVDLHRNTEYQFWQKDIQNLINYLLLHFVV